DLGDQPRELSARHTRELTDLTLGQQRRTTRRHSSHAHILARASTIQRQFYYLDPGREELPEDAIKWMDDLRRTFSDLLLAAMGMPKPGWEFEGVDSGPRNSTTREIATSAVDDLLIGTVATIRHGAEDAPDNTALVAGHFGRAF